MREGLDMGTKKRMTEREIGDSIISAVSSLRVLSCDDSGVLSKEDKGMFSVMATTLSNLLNKKVAERRAMMAACDNRARRMRI